MHSRTKTVLVRIILLSFLLQSLQAFGQRPPVNNAIRRTQCPERAVAYIYDDLKGIEPPLREYMRKATPGELIPIVLVMERQVSEAEKARLLVGRNARSKKDQRAIIIAELKRVAKEDQAEVINFLRSLQRGRPANIRPLWLTNVIGVRATKAAIERLAQLKRIKRIHLDIPRPVKGATAWGVTQIGADSVWTLLPTPYNGTGVVVAILDTGWTITMETFTGECGSTPLKTLILTTNSMLLTITGSMKMGTDSSTT